MKDKLEHEQTIILGYEQEFSRVTNKRGVRIRPWGAHTKYKFQKLKQGRVKVRGEIGLASELQTRIAAVMLLTHVLLSMCCFI